MVLDRIQKLDGSQGEERRANQALEGPVQEPERWVGGDARQCQGSQASKQAFRGGSD